MSSIIIAYMSFNQYIEGKKKNSSFPHNNNNSKQNTKKNQHNFINISIFLLVLITHLLLVVALEPSFVDFDLHLYYLLCQVVIDYLMVVIH